MRALREADRRSDKGYALLAVIVLLALVMVLLLAYATMTRIDLSTTRSSINGIAGFYAAEAGLNIRAEVIEDVFDDYALPSGVGPASGGGLIPCAVGNLGTGDFACVDYALRQRTVTTYIQELAGNPSQILIPRGERYQNLQAQEFRYTLGSRAANTEGRIEASVEMRLKARMVPLFQFIAFYNKDLEILPGPTMTLSGPIHTNGDLYFDPDISLDISGQVSAAGTIYRGEKAVDACQATPLRVLDPAVLSELPNCSGTRMAYVQTDIDPWNDMVRYGFDVVDVPPPGVLDPTPGELYWARSDLRVMLDVNGAPTVEVRDGSDNVDNARTVALAGCAGAAVYSNTLFDNRESTLIKMLDVDLEEFLDCVHLGGLLDGAKTLADATDGGLVLYFGVDGPLSAGLNDYGVRVRNGSEIHAPAVGAPNVQGLTVVTNQAMYVQGHYNNVAKIPAAFLADSINVLSENWNDANSGSSLASRLATPTSINAAFLAGTDDTGGADGVAGQDLGGYNGGLENYPRFHEDWQGQTLTYRGSFVSLNTPLHVSGAWSYGDPIYKAPGRDWDFDTGFATASGLPPLTPRFTYVRQDLQVRRFEP